MYKCEILADSLSPQGDRLTTMKITFPRIILSEFNTHRMFSRNSASSRAIPFKKMVQMVEENPFIPIAWQKDHKGMQGTEYLVDVKDINYVKLCWLEARDLAVNQAKMLSNGDVTKQLCNRLLEPFMWHTVIVTSGEEGLENFFELRCPKILHEGTGKYYRSLKDWNNVDKEIQWLNLTCLHPENKSQADIHIQAIAEIMWDKMNESIPKKLKAGEYHIPFGDNISSDVTLYSKDIKVQADLLDKDLTNLHVKVATARCARISYTTLGDNPKIDYEADIRLHDILLKSKHFSPFEHCAKAMSDDEYVKNIKGWCRNFKGFIQYRHIID